MTEKVKMKIQDLKAIFEKRNFSVPTNEMEFRNTVKDKKMQVRFLSKLIMDLTGWDNDTLEEECPDKEAKLDKFFELYDVQYDSEPDDSEDDGNENEDQWDGDNGGNDGPEIEDKYCRISPDKMNLEEARLFFEQNRSKCSKSEADQINSNNLKIYRNMSVTVNNNLKIRTKIENISRNNVLILDNLCEKVVAVGEIIRKETQEFIIIEKYNIDYSLFGNNSSFNLALLKTVDDELTGEIVYKNIVINLEEPKVTDKVLCIDFGTSNTTAGSYRIKDEFGSTPELVSFTDVTDGNKPVDYYPTVVFVEDCSDPDNVVYRFGFEAKKMEKNNNYESKASVFYQIKHWMIEDSSYNEKIQITDMEGHTAEIYKKDIICAYIQHVILLSEDHFHMKFRELHFTAPVKMKSKFITVLNELLCKYNYTIVQDGIDEAGAILFDYVLDKFLKWKNKKNEDNSRGNVAVIDCGGGTTDLATCNYGFSNADNGTGIDRITMETQFTSGDYNYGGNNITFRIMQLLKLKLAKAAGFISSEEYDKVFERSENDILIDADHTNNESATLYEELDELYKKCEEYIPTKFNDMSDDFFDDDRPKIKRNFYYMWQFAEQVKFTFYREEKEVKKNEWNEAILSIGDSNCNYLYRKDCSNGVLLKLENPFDVEITITEIRKVIFADIYRLLNKILPEKNYDYYRLSGQSCKINLFNELLKEFIPGKKLRAKMEKNLEQVDSITLKKRCIEGSISYIMYNRLALGTEIVSKPSSAERIYDVLFADLSNEYPVIDSDKSLRFYPMKENLAQVSVIVKDQDMPIRKINISTHIDGDVYRIESPDDVIKFIKHGCDDIDWEKTRNKLANYKGTGYGTTAFMVAVPSGDSDGYGFYVFFIKKVIKEDYENYKVTLGRYYNYEAANEGFFDGMR